MENVKVENWNGYVIRFVWKDGDWWAVAKDIAAALDYDTVAHMIRMVDKHQKGVQKVDTLGGTQNLSVVSELGIYDCVFGSRKKEAKEFKLWVYSMLKELRKATGLEGFEVFRMIDREHQKQAMAKLQTALHQPQKVDYIKANTIADKAVSTLYGFEKMVKKSDMSPQMLSDRQSILDDTVNLMALNDKYHMRISVSQTIYQQKGSQAV